MALQGVNLKSIQPHSIFSKQELFKQISLQLCLGNKENEKRNTNNSVRNNLNCFTIHKHKGDILDVSTRS